MKKIIRIISFFVLAASLLSSCRPDPPPPPRVSNTIIVTIDGAVDTFNINPKAEKIGSGTGSFTEITGSAKNGDEFDLKLRNPSVAAGQNYVSTDVNGSYTYFCTLDINVKGHWFGAGYIGNLGTDQKVNVAVSEMTPTEIRGTFSGKIGDETDWNAEKNLTSGTFGVSF